MSDAATLAAYEAGAAGFAQDWHDQPPPHDLHALLRQYFRPGGQTADIGCGSGREVGWLDANGFPATGYDISPALLAQARRRYPGSRFAQAGLPALAGVGDACFDNVLCETVIMHLPPGDIGPAVQRLAGLLKPAGTLYLSWRVTPGHDLRDEHGRLYAHFAPEMVRVALGEALLLHDEAVTSASSGKVIHRIVARRPA